jgi:glutaredoxin 3
MARLTVYSTGTCPICEQSKKLLQKWSIPYNEIRLDLDPSEHRRFSELTQGARMVPQFLIDGKWIGGFTELTEMHMEDELDELMDASAP